MFTPIETSIGAFMLHQATATLLFDNGTILGVSGFLRRLFETGSSTPFLFFTGMALSYASMLQFAPSILPTYPIFRLTRNEMLSALGTGMLMGWGTKVCDFQDLHLKLNLNSYHL
jgi:hypothetical protein